MWLHPGLFLAPLPFEAPCLEEEGWREVSLWTLALWKVGTQTVGGPIKEPQEFYVIIKLGEFDLYGQEMNIWAASQKFPSLYRNTALWVCVSSEFLESSQCLQEAWQQGAECFVQNSAHSLPLEVLLKKWCQSEKKQQNTHKKTYRLY